MSQPIFHAALSKLLTEIFNGPPAHEAYMLNPGDPGLLDVLDSLTAAQASTPPAPGRKTIAAHADHVHYGLTLLNRWSDGEENPWATADWVESWKHTTVTDEQWQSLRARLREAAGKWKTALAARTDWNEIAAAGAISSCAHAAYHLGAIKQILLDVKHKE